MHQDLPTPIALPVCRFRVYSEDPAFQVSWRGGNRFRLSGQVQREPSADLGVSSPDSDVSVSLAPTCTPQQAVDVLRRVLPRALLMHQRTLENSVEISFAQTWIPAAKVPRVRVFSTAPALHSRQLEDNKIELVGHTDDACLLTMLCDNRRTTVEIPRGTSATVAALRLGSNAPHGFRALVDGPVVSIWKDADFFASVA